VNNKIVLLLTLLSGLGFGLNSFAQLNSTPGTPTPGVVAAAKKFLATLDDGQRGKVAFDFKDETQRKRWSNLPTSFVKRAGLRMGDLTQPQREGLLEVLKAALSPQGYETGRAKVKTETLETYELAVSSRPWKSKFQSVATAERQI
jgi:Protein of unknown function (DUF3500)